MKFYHLFEKENQSGYYIDIEKETVNNTDYRRVLYTAKNIQLVLMCLKPNQEIGEEVHNGSQFIRFEQGEGIVTMDDRQLDIKNGSAVVIPNGVRHNVTNTGDSDLKLYALYSPPEHKDQTVDKVKPEGD